MARIFITGSNDGLGRLAAQSLLDAGHQVVLHARSSAKAAQLAIAMPRAEKVLVADLSDPGQTRELAVQANETGRFDAVIHNAGVYRSGNIAQVNSLAPFVLTCAMLRPQRLVYLSSGMHTGADPAVANLASDLHRITYSDSKFHHLLLAKVVARCWPGILANAVDPGWVPTRMGGAGAPDSLAGGVETQVWLAVSNAPAALVSGRYFHHKKQTRYLTAADDIAVQEKFIAFCEKETGVQFPR